MKLGVLCLLVVSLSRTAYADGDIVFAAQFYKWSGEYYRYSSTSKPEQTLAETGDQCLYRINPDGSGHRQITRGARRCTNPVWTRDGRSIRYQCYSRTAHREEIRECDENGGHDRLILAVPGRGEKWKVEWSPDSSSVAITD